MLSKEDARFDNEPMRMSVQKEMARLEECGTWSAKQSRLYAAKKIRDASFARLHMITALKASESSSSTSN